MTGDGDDIIERLNGTICGSSKRSKSGTSWRPSLWLFLVRCSLPSSPQPLPPLSMLCPLCLCRSSHVPTSLSCARCPARCSWKRIKRELTASLYATDCLPCGSSGPGSGMEVRAAAISAPFGLGTVEGGAAADFTPGSPTTAPELGRAAAGAAATADTKAAAGAATTLDGVSDLYDRSRAAAAATAASPGCERRASLAPLPRVAAASPRVEGS